MEESERLRLSAVGGDDVESTAYLGDDEPESMQAILDSLGEVKDVRRGSVVDGVVVRVDPEELLVDIGLKSEGVVSTREDVAAFRDMVSSLQTKIGEMIKQGMTLEQVKAAQPTRDYDGRYGATSGFWTTAQFIEAVYRNLTEERNGG